MTEKTSWTAPCKFEANSRSKNPQMCANAGSPTYPLLDRQQVGPASRDQLDMNLEPPKFKAAFMMSDSQPRTPVEQASLIDLAFDYKHRFGSVSSVATTDDEDATYEITYPWNSQQDEIIKLVYEELLSMPQLTPFTGTVPPSGLLQRVAKDSIRKAKFRDTYFPHSINAVRQRVVDLYHQDQSDTTELERIKIPRDYFSMQYDANLPSSDIVEDDFEFSDDMASHRLMSAEEKYVKQPQEQLAAPFKEPMHVVKECSASKGISKAESEEDVVNIVAKRKRDSMRLKRGPF